MGLRKSIRKFLRIEDHTGDISKLTKQLKTAESNSRELSTTVNELKERVFVIQKHLDFAEAKGTIHSFDGLNSISTEEVAKAIADYISVRKLKLQAGSFEGDDTLRNNIANILPDLNFSDTLPQAPLSLFLFGDVAPQEIERTLERLIGENLLVNGALVQLPTVRHTFLIDSAIKKTSNYDLNWIPWRIFGPSGIFVIFWRNED